MAGSSDPMTLGIDGGRNDVDLRPRMPPYRHALEPADQLARHLLDAAPFLGQLRPLRRRVVERPRPAEQRHLGLQSVDLIKRAEDREDEVGVVLPVRNRRGEGVPQSGEEFLVGSVCHAVRLEPPTSILGAAGRRCGGSAAALPPGTHSVCAAAIMGSN